MMLSIEREYLIWLVWGRYDKEKSEISDQGRILNFNSKIFLLLQSMLSSISIAHSFCVKLQERTISYERNLKVPENRVNNEQGLLKVNSK